MKIRYIGIILFSLNLIAQTDTLNVEKDLFYIEVSQPINNLNEESIGAEYNQIERNTELDIENEPIDNYGDNKALFDIVNKNKPIFLTGKSDYPIRGDYYSGNELCYNFIYSYENGSQELRYVPLTNKLALYPNRIINDSIIEAKSKSEIYYIFRKGLEYKQVSNSPEEFNEAYLSPVYFYFYKYKNEPSIKNAIKCFAESKLKIYNWNSEFDMQDNVNLLTQKILKNTTLRNNLVFYKEFEVTFNSYDFSRNSYTVELESLIETSDFFNNDFGSKIYFKGASRYNKRPIEREFEFICNEIKAREISNLFDYDRKVNLKFELVPAIISNLCVCNYCEYENEFYIKSIVITSNSNKYDSVQLNFD